MQDNNLGDIFIGDSGLVDQISGSELKLLFDGIRHDVSSSLMVLSAISYQISNISKSLKSEQIFDKNSANINSLISLSDRIHQTVCILESIADGFSKDIEGLLRFPKIDLLYPDKELYKAINHILDRYDNSQKAKINWNRDVSFSFKFNSFWFNKIIIFILDSFFDNNPNVANIYACLNKKKKKLFIELKNFNKNIKIYNLDFCKKIMNIFGGNFYIDQKEYITNIQLVFIH